MIIPNVIPLNTAFSFLSFSLLIFAPVPNIDFIIAQINCIGYVNVKTFIKFLSTINPNANHDNIGINEKMAELKVILNNRFIFLFLLFYFVLFYIFIFYHKYHTNYNIYKYFFHIIIKNLNYQMKKLLTFNLKYDTLYEVSYFKYLIIPFIL